MANGSDRYGAAGFPTPAAFRWLQEQFGRRVDASFLALFRIVWGGLMVYEGFRKLDKANSVYSPDYFHFKYALFPWVEPFPEQWMVYAETGLIIAAPVAMCVGCFPSAEFGQIGSLI